MPRVTPQFGDIIAGVGAAVSLNRVAIAERGTNACFLDPTRAMYQRLMDAKTDRWKLEVYDLATQQFHDVPYGERGAHRLAARGGRWMAWVNKVGVYDETGTIWPYAALAADGAGRAAIGQDGTVGFVRDYQGGHGLQLLATNGETVDLPDIAIVSLAIYDRSVAVWVEHGQIKAYGRQDPAPQAEPVSSARPLKVGSVWLLLVTTNDRLLLRRWETPVGKVIVPTPTGFSADAAPMTATTARVAWSVTLGERPEDILFLDVALDELVEPLGAPAPVPVPVPEPPKEPIPMPSVNHADLVQRVAAKMPPDGTLAGNFAFVNAVRVAANDGAGFVKSSQGGENTIAYAGGYVRTSRLVYSDGHLYKLIADAGPGGANRPQWVDEGPNDPGLYVVATVDPLPVPAPPSETGDLAQLRAENARLRTEATLAAAARAALERELADLKAQHRVEPPSYDAMMQLVSDMNVAYRGAQRKKEKDKRDITPAAVAHLVRRYLLEGYTVAALMADARERGAGA